MVTNLKRVTILIVIFTVSIYATCKKRLDCASTIHSFAINAKAYPSKDSINIYDTLWIEINQAVSLIDNVSGNTIDYTNAENLGMVTTIDEFVGGSINNPGTIPAANKFNFEIQSGNLLQNTFIERVRSFNFLEKQGIYLFKVGIVPHQKGIYGIAISNAANVYRKNDKCTKASFAITFKDTDQHLYLYQQNRPDYTISEYEKTHLYCVKVK